MAEKDYVRGIGLSSLPTVDQRTLHLLLHLASLERKVIQSLYDSLIVPFVEWKMWLMRQHLLMKGYPSPNPEHWMMSTLNPFPFKAVAQIDFVMEHY